jgi:anti-sigma factor RsiW
MNCRVFQNLRFEFLDDALTDDQRRAAGEHLSTCVQCRDSVEQERRLAERLRSGFHEQVAPLAADRDLAQRVSARVHSLPARDAARVIVRFPMLFRFSAAAGVVFAIGIGLLLKRPVTPRIEDRQAADQVTIQLSYCAPTYTFQRSGSYVVDALTCESNSVTGTLFSKLD